MLARQPIDDRRHQPRADRLRAADPHLTDRRVRKEFDFLYALSQFVENCHASLDERVPIARWLNPLRTAIEKRYAQCELHFGDRL